MRILINDFKHEQERYKNIFRNFGYEENELIFFDSFQRTKDFITEQLVKNKLHIDAVITNESSKEIGNPLKAGELSHFKNDLKESYSKGNFRINAIPIILYSNNQERKNIKIAGFDNTVMKNTEGQHDKIVSSLEGSIKNWRKELINDLESLNILKKDLLNFHESHFYKSYYKQEISRNSETYFLLKTNIVSQEFIKLPSPLIYDWLLLERNEIEQTIDAFNSTYNNHLKYDRQNNERTVLHDFFNKNKMILLREAFIDLEYEKNLYDLNGKTNEECDYILKTEFPDFLKTTFFEVKKEDVTFYVKKKTKRPQISSNYLSHLEQVWRYKQYSENNKNEEEIKSQIGYKTKNFEHILLAGRKEEKLEMNSKFSSDLDRMFKGISVITYEELEELNIEYYDKFNRLKVDLG
ncbi:Shedu anti-phage system protein SduA domain-containing protein [uncultured Christiangramia sp.]|uniref:Shedu anti-phage system protein SduA domain-containing protein n=1 Tax=uncultured Christiangramia sp. TaxID=503836 RepID=UPI00261F4981|nr:Shedu anti-phage system protein SduA domain-containing protein [uncultured Christiangramia sp.]